MWRLSLQRALLGDFNYFLAQTNVQNKFSKLCRKLRIKSVFRSNHECETVFSKIKRLFDKLTISNISSFNKILHLLHVLLQQNQIFHQFCEKQNKRQIIYDRIRTKKICVTYYFMVLSLKISHDLIRSDASHSISDSILQSKSYEIFKKNTYNIIGSYHMII